MIRYTNYSIVFQEIPGEVTLALNISNCPHRCKGCHSPELQQDIGNELTTDVLNMLIDRYEKYISCVCFMGEGQDEEQLASLCQIVTQRGYACGLYTGFYSAPEKVLPYLTYLKVGPYIEDLGGLASPRSNQTLYRISYTEGDMVRHQILPKQGETHG